MADINIQRKKNSPSPWLLVLLVVAALAVAAYFMFRADTAPASVPPVPTDGASTPADFDTTAQVAAPGQEAAVANMATTDAAPATPAELTAYAASEPGPEEYAQYSREGLRLIKATLVEMADRGDLRDPTVSEQRDQLTSATDRLDEPNTSLRPGFMAVASLLKAMQQKGYPDLEFTANDLVLQSQQFSGRTGTEQERKWVHTFFIQTAKLIQAMNGSAS